MGSMQAGAWMDPAVCPVTRTLDLVGSRWTPLVIYHLHTGTMRYGELQRALPGISPKTLAERLRALEQHGLLVRTVYPDKPPRVEYTLTEKGYRLGDILHEIADWAETADV
ncbi:helix-turn-helix domain-containing protein [Nocardia beijingensis]|uniref:winged helix-turn-helix transcriptional regulator n=1 Tax=Nocardia beijingensis TaxID=95162 RepID=UPI0033C91BEC